MSCEPSIFVCSTTSCTSLMTKNALSIIEKLNRTDQELQEMVAEASINAKVAQLLYEARTKAGLTQQQLASADRASSA